MAYAIFTRMIKCVVVVVVVVGVKMGWKDKNGLGHFYP